MITEPWIEIRVLDAIAFGAAILAGSAIWGYIISGEAAALLQLDRHAARAPKNRVRVPKPAGAPELESF